MTTINMSFKRPQASGVDGAARGVITWAPTARRDMEGYILLPKPFKVELDSNGQATVVVLPTTSNWFWKVTENFQFPSGHGSTEEFYYIVPDSPTAIDYDDLVRVNQTSGTEIPPNNAWNILLDGKQNLSEKGQPNGYASLDNSGDVPLENLSPFVSNLSLKGVWDADTNTPTLADGSGSTGDLYLVTTTAVRDLGSGEIDWTAMIDYAYLGDGLIWRQFRFSPQVGTSIKTLAISPPLTATDIPALNNPELTGLEEVTSVQQFLDLLLSSLSSFAEVLGYLAYLDSPVFTGTPTRDATPDGSTPEELADVAYVKSRTLTATASLDFPSIAAQTATTTSFQTRTITVTGAEVGDAVVLGPPSNIAAGLIWEGYVSATNTVTIRLGNCTAAPIDPASATWRATVLK